jgi:hypothetical protein
MVMVASTAAFICDVVWARSAFLTALRTEPLVVRPVIRLIRLTAAARIWLVPVASARIGLVHGSPLGRWSPYLRRVNGTSTSQGLRPLPPSEPALSALTSDRARYPNPGGDVFFTSDPRKA